MSNNSSQLKDQPKVVDLVLNWKDYPEIPGVKWKESDFCRCVDVEDGEIYFQYRIDDAPHPVLRDCVLSASGNLERMDVVAGERELERRISNIKSQNGIPDLSLVALDKLRQKKQETNPTFPLDQPS